MLGTHVNFLIDHLNNQITHIFIFQNDLSSESLDNRYEAGAATEDNEHGEDSREDIDDAKIKVFQSG